MTSETELNNDALSSNALNDNVLNGADDEALRGADDMGDELYEPYRTVSKAAVFSLVMAVFSLTALLFPVLLLAAALAVILGLIGWRNLRRYPDELTGKTAAMIGLIGGFVLLTGGAAMHTYIYVTEVPAGYERITFGDLEINEKATSLEEAFPVELDGKRIFVKGYVHPGVSELGEIKKFVLVPDMGTCCFGGQPALNDMIEVTITGEQGVRYTQRKRKFAGTFHVTAQKRQVVGGLNGGYYTLEADYVR